MANIYIVAYDILDDEDDERRKQLRDAIESKFLDHYEHFELSVYLVASRKETTEEVYDVLEPFTESGDRLFVGSIPSGSTWRGCPGLEEWFAANRAA